MSSRAVCVTYDGLSATGIADREVLSECELGKNIVIYQRSNGIAMHIVGVNAERETCLVGWSRLQRCAYLSLLGP